MKRLAVLGSTGSIGRQTLEVVRAFLDRLQVVGLAAARSWELLLAQAQEFGVGLISLAMPVPEVEGPSGCQFISMDEMASRSEVDLVMVATSGPAGLAPTLAAMAAKKAVALANKEVLVMAGELVMAAARRHGVEILPVDSEPSAIWQCLRGENRSEVARLILTASGGAFRDRPAEALAAVTAREALGHPTWRMGPKVTIDSATLMNKGMEAIEASWLFGVPLEKIDIVIHRESIVHSMVEFVDGSVKAQLSPPDMRLPIQEALSYPERWPSPWGLSLDWSRVGALSFAPPDFARFPCLGLALEAGRRGGTYPAVLAAADEVAVERFIAGDIGFTDIPRLVVVALEHHQGGTASSLDDILAADQAARRFARAWRP